MNKNLSVKAIKSKYKSQIDRKNKAEKIENDLVNDVTNLMIDVFNKSTELKAIKAHLTSTKRKFKTSMNETFTELNKALKIVNRELQKNIIGKKVIKNG